MSKKIFTSQQWLRRREAVHRLRYHQHPANVANPKPESICMGLNACKGSRRFGTNACAGMGYCATAQYHGATQQTIAAVRAAADFAGSSTEEQNRPGENHCPVGSCGYLYRPRRYSLGANMGKSVDIGLKLFEERMAKARRNVGESPV